MKYAIITVNYKLLEGHSTFTKRRILIKYDNITIEDNIQDNLYGARIYHGVKVISKDPYFSLPNDKVSYKYEFPDGKDYYIAYTNKPLILTEPGFFDIKVNKEKDIEDISIYKKYYSIPKSSEYFMTSDLYLPFEFEVDNDEDARLRFEMELLNN